MKKKGLIFIVLMTAVVFVISGCGTVPKKFKEEVGGIKTRVDTLESRVEGVETKQAEVERAASEQAQALDEMKREKTSRARTNISVKGRFDKGKENIKDVQLCLKNAGFYLGKIDGIKGKNTKNAIKQFQRASGLKADGIVGKRTWELLSKYADMPAPASSGTEEGTK